MLTKLLKRETCAECRLCCVFDSSDIWETPVISEEVRHRIENILPEVEFLSKGEKSYLFRIRHLDEGDLFYCPILTDTGCRLGTEKPFDCQIWPYRVMEVEGKIAITIAPICEAMMRVSLGELTGLLKESLADVIFRYAQDNPDIIKPYDPMYPILLWKREEVTPLVYPYESEEETRYGNQ